MVLWQWIALLGQIAAIFSIGRMVDCILMHQMSDQVILTTFMVLVVAVAIRFLCDQMATRASFAASVDVKRILREKIYEKLLCLGASYREHVSTSEVVQMSTEGVEQLEIYFGKYLPQLFYSILAPVTLFYHFILYQFKGKCGTADLRSIDSDFNRCGAETRKEIIE